MIVFFIFWYLYFITLIENYYWFIKNYLPSISSMGTFILENICAKKYLLCILFWSFQPYFDYFSRYVPVKRNCANIKCWNSGNILLRASLWVWCRWCGDPWRITFWAARPHFFGWWTSSEHHSHFGSSRIHQSVTIFGKIGKLKDGRDIYVADKAELRCWELFRIKLYSEIFCDILPNKRNALRV